MERNNIGTMNPYELFLGQEVFKIFQCLSGDQPALVGVNHNIIFQSLDKQNTGGDYPEVFLVRINGNGLDRRLR